MGRFMRAIEILTLSTLILVLGALPEAPSANSLVPRSTSMLAQARPEEAPISSQRTINLSEEQRHIIREAIFADRPQSDRQPNESGDKAAANIGDVIPPGVETHDFPELVSTKIPALKSHVYLIRAGQIVVVDAKDRKIADVVK